MMFTVYADKEVFENIIVFNETAPRWYSILCNHAEVCVNMDDVELLAEQMEGTPIFEYIKANGARSPIALKDFFETMEEDPAIIATKPRSAFLLNIDQAAAQDWQNSYGVIVQSGKALDDDILSISFKRKLLKGEEIGEGLAPAWKHLLQFELPPSNALVVLDNYLLPATENVKGNTVKAGMQNLLWLLDVVLPPQLAVAYHVTVISEDGNQPENWRNQLAGELNIAVKALRPFEINVEVVFTKSEHFHDRLLLMNYVNASAEHGFYAFKCKDKKTVHMVNKIQLSTYFCVLSQLGDSEFATASKDLRLIKDVCDDLAAYITKGNPGYLGAILGGCKADKKLTNRLINDV